MLTEGCRSAFGTNDCCSVGGAPLLRLRAARIDQPKLLIILLVTPFRIERLPTFRDPQVPRTVAFMALQLGGDPEHSSIDYGAIVIGQLDDACLDDETAEFDQLSGAFAALDLPRPHLIASLS